MLYISKSLLGLLGCMRPLTRHVRNKYLGSVQHAYLRVAHTWSFVAVGAWVRCAQTYLVSYCCADGGAVAGALVAGAVGGAEYRGGGVYVA
eukprot:1157723-Pelagomonas_calceolata.AAC.5